MCVCVLHVYVLHDWRTTLLPVLQVGGGSKRWRSDVAFSQRAQPCHCLRHHCSYHGPQMALEVPGMTEVQVAASTPEGLLELKVTTLKGEQGDAGRRHID